MARNEEKAQSMLHRYLRSKENAAAPRRRPPRATLCDDVDQATHWLRQVVRELRAGVADIQNDALEEGKLRDLNDALNRLLRDRRAWERRVRALGGDVPADLAQPAAGPLAAAGSRRRAPHRPKRGRDGAPKAGDDDEEEAGEEGEGVIEIDGFFYFGAARKLPGVADLAKKRAARRNGAPDPCEADAFEELLEQPRALAARLDRTYFGLNERGAARADARRAEEALRARAVEAWERARRGSGDDDDDDDDDDGDVKDDGADAAWDESFRAFVGKRPDSDAQADVMQRLLLERKKAEALELLRAGTRAGSGDAGDDAGTGAPS